MTDNDESYRTDGGHPSWGVNPRIGKTPDAEANKIAEEAYRNIVRNPVPSSTELIAMANLEWKNREERRGIHNKEDWCCGWMAGFLSVDKPDWVKAQVQAAREDEQRKWRDEHPGDLVWMTPEEEEARIRRDEREKVLDMVLPAFWKYAERLFDDIPTPSWREASNNLEEAIQSLRIPGTQTPVKEREP